MRLIGGVLATAAALFASASTAVAQLPLLQERFPHVNSYEDGTLVPPWYSIHEPEPGRMSVTTSPTDPSHNVMRVELRGGDLYEDAARAEAVDRIGRGPSLLWPDPPFSERWYGWKTYLAPGFPSPADTWTIVTQWHDWRSGSPPFAVLVDGGRFEVHRQGEQFTDWSASATAGAWHSFVVNIRWSPFRNGAFELWHNGVRVISESGIATSRLHRITRLPLAAYLKQGIYRDRTIADTAVLYHDTVRIGTSREMVEP